MIKYKAVPLNSVVKQEVKKMNEKMKNSAGSLQKHQITKYQKL